MGSPLVHIHYLRPPARLEIFTQHLVYDSSEVKITLARDIPFDPPLVIDGDVVLEEGSDVVWFTFPGEWHDIGRFHTAEGAFTGLYANILTPPVFREDRLWETTDLFLDLWIPAAAGQVTLLDEDQFHDAVEEGWIDSGTAARAQVEVDSLVSRARAEAWPPRIVGEWPLERARGAVG